MADVPLPYRLIGSKVWLNCQGGGSPLNMIHYDELLSLIDNSPIPRGFRVPAASDFDDLLSQVGGDTVALRSVDIGSVGAPTVWRDVYPTPTNASGLACEPRGWIQDGSLRDEGTCAAFWTTSTVPSGLDGQSDLYNVIVRFCGYQWFSDVYTSGFIHDYISPVPGHNYGAASVMLVADFSDTEWADEDPPPPGQVSRHAPMLRVLKGGSLGPADEARIKIDAKYLDDVMFELQDIFKEVFPDTAIDLSKWASVYGISAEASRDEILGYYSESNTAINAGSLVDIAAQMGYVIEVIGGDVMPFRADISKCDIDIVRVVNGGVAGHSYPFGGLYPDPPDWRNLHPGYVYSPDFWIITIRVLDIGPHQNDALLRSAFEQIKRADTTLNWIEAWNV